MSVVVASWWFSTPGPFRIGREANPRSEPASSGGHSRASGRRRGLGFPGAARIPRAACLQGPSGPRPRKRPDSEDDPCRRRRDRPRSQVEHECGPASGAGNASPVSAGRSDHSIRLAKPARRPALPFGPTSTLDGERGQSGGPWRERQLGRIGASVRRCGFGRTRTGRPSALFTKHRRARVYRVRRGRSPSSPAGTGEDLAALPHRPGRRWTGCRRTVP